MNQTMTDPRQIELVDEFSLFGDWSERYQYLIDLGRALPPLPHAERTAEHKVDGCQSQVWLVATGNADRLDFRAGSDSTIVAGLLALLLKVYSGRSAREILDTAPDFIRAIGLDKHLSMTRSNGLGAVLTRMRQVAAAHVSD